MSNCHDVCLKPLHEFFSATIRLSEMLMVCSRGLHFAELMGRLRPQMAEALDQKLSAEEREMADETTRLAKRELDDDCAVLYQQAAMML